MEAFARTIDAAKKYVVSSTLERVDWNAELVLCNRDLFPILLPAIDPLTLTQISRIRFTSRR